MADSYTAEERENAPGQYSRLYNRHDVDKHLLMLRWQQSEVEKLHGRPDSRLSHHHGAN